MVGHPVLGNTIAIVDRMSMVDMRATMVVKDHIITIGIVFSSKVVKIFVIAIAAAIQDATNRIQN